MKHIPFYLLSVSLLTLAGCSDNDSTPIAPSRKRPIPEYQNLKYSTMINR